MKILIFKNLKDFSPKKVILGVMGFVIVIGSGYYLHKYPVTNEGKLEICADYQYWLPYQEERRQMFINKLVATNDKQSEENYNRAVSYLAEAMRFLQTTDNKFLSEEYSNHWKMCETELKKFPKLFHIKYKTKVDPPKI
jgi:hypothetical protein